MTHVDAPRQIPTAVRAPEDDPSLDTPKQSSKGRPEVRSELPFVGSHKSRVFKGRDPDALQASFARTLRQASAFCSGRAETLLAKWKKDARECRRLARGDLFAEELTAYELIHEARAALDEADERGGVAELLCATQDDLALEELRRDRQAWEFVPFPLQDALFDSARLGKLSEAVARCSRFVETQRCSDCRRVAPAVADPRIYRCGARGCMLCEPVRAAKMLRFLKPIERVAAHTLKLLTLTVPNVSTLLLPEGRATSLLSRCYRELRYLLKRVPICYACRRFCPEEESRARWRTRWKRRLRVCLCASAPPEERPERKGQKGPAPRDCAITASLRGIEVTYNRRTKWHPHIHALVSAPFLAQEALADAWSEITRELWPGGAANAMGVDVRIVRDKRTGKTVRENGCNVESALRECLKYPTKVADLCGQPVELAEWVKASRGRRFVQATGEWARWAKDLREAETEKLTPPLPELGPCPECGCEDYELTAVEIGSAREARRSSFFHGPAKVPR